MSQAEEVEVYQCKGYVDYNHYARLQYVSGCYSCIECGLKLKERMATNCVVRCKQDPDIRESDLVCDGCLPMHLTLCKLAN